MKYNIYDVNIYVNERIFFLKKDVKWLAKFRFTERGRSKLIWHLICARDQKGFSFKFTIYNCYYIKNISFKNK